MRPIWFRRGDDPAAMRNDAATVGFPRDGPC